MIKGIAFPDPPPLKDLTFNYNATAWIAILQQLRDAVPNKDALNTVRIYRMDPTLDYSEFFEAAEEMGFYILVPLTGSTGGGVLDRTLPAPECYNRTLYAYGVDAINNYAQYPNVLSGVIGNEVMNDLDSWYAAPCVKAYGHDLQRYMHSDEFQSNLSRRYKHNRRTIDGTSVVPIPLMYATQHSGIGAALTETDAIRLTVDYFGCQGDGDNGTDHGQQSLDIFGINVESWCSSFDTFEFDEQGGVGAYYQLYQALHNAIDMPLFFSEMGCSRLMFNKDNHVNVGSVAGTRDWRQVPVVLHEMNATWSGFSAYAYSGNPQFYMMGDEKGGASRWDGASPLSITQDFENFQSQLLQEAEGQVVTTRLEKRGQASGGKFHDLPMAAGGIMDRYYEKLTNSPESSPMCSAVLDVLDETNNLKLLEMSEMPSYFQQNHVVASLGHHLLGISLLGVCAAMAVLSCTLMGQFRGWHMYETIP